MSDTSGGADWIQANDGKWYPPEQMTGWEQRDDGKWYEVPGPVEPPAGEPADDGPAAAPEPTEDLDDAAGDAEPPEDGADGTLNTKDSAGDAEPPEGGADGTLDTEDVTAVAPAVEPMVLPPPQDAHPPAPAAAGPPSRKLGWPFWVAAAAAAVFLVAAVVVGATGAATREDLQADLDQVTAERDAALADVEDTEADAEEQVAAAQEEADQTVEDAQDQLDNRASRLDDREAGIVDREAELDDQAAYLEELIGATEASQFGDGVFLVGTDIQPGRYRNEGGGSCYWARLSGVSGDFSEILANDNVSGQAVVDIASSDVAFESVRCGTWTKIG